MLSLPDLHARFDDAAMQPACIPQSFHLLFGIDAAWILTTPFLDLEANWVAPEDGDRRAEYEWEPGSPRGAVRGLGSTRLGRLIALRRRELLQRWNNARRHFPSKIFLLLLGFFSANALATILGQTGDWDVIAAGILVAIIEGIGHLMYNSRLWPAFLGSRGKDIIELVNYWKIGFTFALFVDAFKVGS